MSRKKSSIDDLFSERLKTFIKKNGVSQVYLSDKIGISQSYLSAVLKGKRGASAELIAGLYVHYREYLDWLLTGEGEMIRKPENDPESSPIYNKVETELLKRIIARVEKNLAHKRKEMDAEKKAELISLLYEYFTETNKEVETETVERYLRLVA